MVGTSAAFIKKFLTITLLLFTTLFVTAAFAKPPRLVAKLIHRDSVHSPYYNPNATRRAKRELKSSIARFAFLLGIKTSTNIENDYRVGVIPEDTRATFMANISIGEPPMVQLLSMDTGSNLLWFQCLPCTKCFQQSVPIFDPSKSSTYKNLSCHSPYCFNDKCDLSDRCEYNMGYFDGTNTTGNLAYEKLTFETSDEGISTISDILVGCGHENVYLNGQVSGMLGLGPRDDISLVFRTGQKFSYCIGDINDPTYNYNNLILGDGAIIEGNLSPLEFYRGHYYVSLEGISVGEKRLDIDPNIFKRSIDTGKGGVIIDSGATMSFLAPGAYQPLYYEVQSVIHRRRLVRILSDPDPSNTPVLCYYGNMSVIKGFPPVTFHFAGGADLVLDVNNMFFQNGPGQFCMSVFENPLNRTSSLIGVRAQQYYNVAYDLVGKTISFYKIDCQLLEP